MKWKQSVSAYLSACLNIIYVYFDNPRQTVWKDQHNTLFFYFYLDQFWQNMIITKKILQDNFFTESLNLSPHNVPAVKISRWNVITLLWTSNLPIFHVVNLSNLSLVKYY